MVILGVCQPLVDILSEVDVAVLEKYGLELNNAILAEEKHQPLFAELAAMNTVQYIAGGTTQNSMRVAQWMLQEPGATAFLGCIGNDAFADKMKEGVAKDGVNCVYMVDEATPTGCCAVLVNGGERSLCTTLNAANNYKASHLQQPENWAILGSAKIVYTSGFFIPSSPESITLTSQQAAKSGAIYCMNLAAPYIMQVPSFKAFFVETMPFVDILFGNETEAQTWAETEGWETNDIAFIATRLSLIPSAKARKRTVVITQGSKATIVATNGITKESPVTPLPPEKMVDTNGAGDAFVGGFLAALSKGADIEACCKAGTYSASVIIQHSGCTYPDQPDYAL